MSNFICNECGELILDSPTGYITECEHWPLDSHPIASDNGCTKCGGTILIDTEHWDQPLCGQCYEHVKK